MSQTLNIDKEIIDRILHPGEQTCRKKLQFFSSLISLIRRFSTYTFDYVRAQRIRIDIRHQILKFI